VCARGAVAREDASWQSWAQREVRVAGGSGNEYRSRACEAWRDAIGSACGMCAVVSESGPPVFQ
jgi:hypothetical protein